MSATHAHWIGCQLPTVADFVHHLVALHQASYRLHSKYRDGELLVIEVELLESALFMEHDPPAAERFAEAALRRLLS